MPQKLVFIKAFDLDDAWFQCINTLLDVGVKYTIGKGGSFEGGQRLEFDFVTIQITNPGHRPIIPLMPEGAGLPAPTDMEYIEKTYLPYLLTDQKKPGEDYTYGERLTNPKIKLEEMVNGQKQFKEYVININPVEESIKKHLLCLTAEEYSETNQATMEIGQPSDIILHDPPCLRIVDTRVRRDGDAYKLHFYLYFRSWDLWGGFPSNLAGLQLMKEYVVSRLNDELQKSGSQKQIEDGEIIATSKGLHLYNYVWELAELRTQKKLKNK